MKFGIHLSALILGIVMSLASNAVLAKGVIYKVTITNLSRNLILTPILVASHRKGVNIFKLGEGASEELEKLAEGGDIVPLSNLLAGDSRVVDIDNSGAPLGPGHSVTVEVDAVPAARYITIASMELPTNDGFIALNGVKVPKNLNKSTTFYSPVYDAGTEENDELCDNIPGPRAIFCMDMDDGEGYSPELGEGYVHVHGGIHGIGDLMPHKYDWRNPAAKITIERVKN